MFYKIDPTRLFMFVSYENALIEEVWLTRLNEFLISFEAKTRQEMKLESRPAMASDVWGPTL